MNPILDLLLEGERLPGSAMQRIAGESPERITELLRSKGASERLLQRRLHSLPAIVGGDYLHLNVELYLDPEWLPEADRLSEALVRMEPVETCYMMAGQASFLVFAAFRSVHEAASWISELADKLPGILDTSSQFLLSRFGDQGFIKIHG